MMMDKNTSNELPTVSIIILNYNGKRYLNDCLKSLDKIHYPHNRYEVLFIDNCSSDDSVFYVKTNFPWVKVISLSHNYGFTGGNNLGVRLARGEYVVLLNNDVVVTEDWLIELVKYSEIEPNAILTSKALFLDNPQIINFGGVKATLIGRGFSPKCGEKDDPTIVETPMPIIQPYGASMMLKKKIFEEIGGFDEDYVTCLEDLDIGLRAWLYGFKTIYVPASIFYHVAGGTTGRGRRMTDKMLFHVTKNSYLNILKNFDLLHVIIGSSLSICYYCELSIWLLFKSKNSKQARIITQSHIWVVRNLVAILAKRSLIKKREKVTNSFLFNKNFFASPSEMIRAHTSIRNISES